MQQNIPEIVLRDDDEAVRLLNIGCNLAEKDTGCKTDRAGQALPYSLAEAVAPVGKTLLSQLLDTGSRRLVMIGILGFLAAAGVSAWWVSSAVPRHPNARHLKGPFLSAL
jgi:hypothetical protein